MIQIGRNEYSTLGHECVDPYECPICIREEDIKSMADLKGYNVINAKHGNVKIKVREDSLYLVYVEINYGYVYVIEYDKEEREFTYLTDLDFNTIDVINVGLSLYKELYDY